MEQPADAGHELQVGGGIGEPLLGLLALGDLHGHADDVGGLAILAPANRRPGREPAFLLAGQLDAIVQLDVIAVLEVSRRVANTGAVVGMRPVLDMSRSSDLS